MTPLTFILTLLSLLLFSFTGTVKANYADSCKDIKTYFPEFLLEANCRNNNGDYILSLLDLNACVANWNGNLGCAQWGNAGGTCYWCDIWQNNFPQTQLHCFCHANDGSVNTPVGSFLVLDDCVDNFNGFLGCFGVLVSSMHSRREIEG